MVIPWRVLGVATIAMALFLFLPGDLRHRAHLLLQGVCAQRTSHSFVFSGQPLPVDARMTGIYLGAGSSLLWYLVICPRGYAGRFTSRAWLVLVSCVGIMALDGLNSLATDLGLATPYLTTNLARVATGLLAGVAIGAFLGHLATISLTHRPRGGWVAMRVGSIAPPLLFSGMLCALAASGLPTLALPLTVVIVASALAVLWTMTSVVLSLALGRGWGYSSARQRDETLALALVAAGVLLLALAAWREVLELLVPSLGLS